MLAFWPSSLCFLLPQLPPPLGKPSSSHSLWAISPFCPQAAQNQLFFSPPHTPCAMDAPELPQHPPAQACLFPFLSVPQVSRKFPLMKCVPQTPLLFLLKTSGVSLGPWCHTALPAAAAALKQCSSALQKGSKERAPLSQNSERSLHRKSDSAACSSLPLPIKYGWVLEFMSTSVKSATGILWKFPIMKTPRKLHWGTTRDAKVTLKPAEHNWALFPHFPACWAVPRKKWLKMSRTRHEPTTLLLCGVWWLSSAPAVSTKRFIWVCITTAERGGYQWSWDSSKFIPRSTRTLYSWLHLPQVTAPVAAGDVGWGTLWGQCIGASHPDRKYSGSPEGCQAAASAPGSHTYTCCCKCHHRNSFSRAGDAHIALGCVPTSSTHLPGPLCCLVGQDCLAGNYLA